jgi:transcriptional regulator with XRE-family HTH domain
MPTNDEFSLIRLRKGLGLGQSEMAQRMGLSLRPYQELETNIRKVLSRHVRLAESVALDVAIEKQDPELAPENVRNKAFKFARLILEQNFEKKARKLAKIILEQD